MNRSLEAALIIAILLATASCGGTAFIISPGDGTIFFASGTISLVQLTVHDGVQLTVVTLSNAGVDQTFNFCGDVGMQFPPGSFIRARYRHSNGCDMVVQVTH